MRKSRRNLLVLVALLCLWVGVSAGHVLADSPVDGVLDGARSWAATRGAEQDIQRAWEMAREAGSYRLVADVEQVLLPRPVSGQIGEGETAVDVRLEGEAHLPDRAVLTLRVEADGTSARPVTLYRDGDKVFMKEGAHLELVDDPSGSGLVDADYLGAVYGFFEPPPPRWACVLPYAHPVVGTSTERSAILLYELYLRYHTLHLAWAGSPYGYHTIGSALACTARAYAAVSGMNRRRGGDLRAAASATNPAPSTPPRARAAR